MPGILIVADDYTGANDTAVLMAQRGFHSYTILSEEDSAVQDSACTAVSTDSRGLSPEAAYRRVFDATRRYMKKNTFLLSKRIDSTLRGNLGAEICAMLDAVGDERCAMVVPTFPSAGRVYKDRCLYVNGVPLDETAAAKDPGSPVRTRSALCLLREQSRCPVDEIRIGDLKLSVKDLSLRMKKMKAKGTRIIVCEAETEADLRMLAESALQMREPFICADPGAFSCVVADLYQMARRGFKLLFLIGSVNDVTASQMRRLSHEKDTLTVYVEMPRLPEKHESENPVSALDDAALKIAGKARRELDKKMAAASGDIKTLCLCTSGIFPENRVDFTEYESRNGLPKGELSTRFDRLMGDLAAGVILSHPEIKGAAACGGDTAIALCRSLGAKGEYPLEEVIPLAVYGKLAGGARDGLPVITKGGMIGDEDTLIRCRDYLYRRIWKEEQV